MYYLKKKTTPKKKKIGLSPYIRKLDRIFSEYIRLRDSRPFGYKAFRCISCGQVKPYEEMDCGHFVGRTHMSTRFDEENCNGECRACNRFSSDHMIYYQRNLEKKIGADRVDLLIARGRGTKKWTAWELEILTKHYEEEVKRMKSEKV